MKNKSSFLSAFALVTALGTALTTSAIAAPEATPAAQAQSQTPGANLDSKKYTVVDFRRSPGQNRMNIEAGPFAFGADNSYGLHVGGTLEYWDLDKSHIQSIGGSYIIGTTKTINISGAMLFEALPRLYVGGRLGMVWGDKTGFGALTARVLGSDPDGQKFFSILYTQIDLGLKSGGGPYGALVFGFKLF